ncbi:MAG TPA: phospholipase D-like domain-containing protein [Myxococcales bacterium]|nr:phospholipase D-like domain-containing protein [Myxococcales bacterium]
MRLALALLVALRAAVALAAPLELVESYPVETTLRDPELAQAVDVWPAMIASARRSLDFGEFYATSRPGSRLEPVLAAIQAAAARGVRVRFLADAGFAAKEPETLARLRAMPGVTVRPIDWAHAMGGGVYHAKYFLVDGREAYLGSQNFDWRSLTHIEELGVRIRIHEVVDALGEIFAADWARAGGKPVPAFVPVHFPVEATTGKGPLRVTFEAEPEAALSDRSLFGLPKLVALIDSAKASVRVQLLTYQASHDQVRFDDLEAALERAAARGAHVQLLVSDWCKRPDVLEGLRRLARVPGLEVRFLDIPEAKAGFIPYARVAHAKYLVVDGRRAWVGTSNWERDYFYLSRNVGVLVDGASFAGPLDRFFERGWTSSYAEQLDPARAYAAPRISR